MMHLLRKNIISIWVFYFVIAFVFTYPGILHLSSHIFGDGGDNVEYISYAFLIKERLNSGAWPFAHTATFWYPEGFDLAIGSEAKLFTLATALLSYILPLTTSYNLMVIVVLALNSAITFCFFRKIGNSIPSAFVGGVIYGMSYYVLSKAGGHINLMMVFPIPLFCCYLADIYMRRAVKQRDVLGCMFAVLLLMMSSVQYAAIVLATLMLLTPMFLLLIPRVRTFSLEWKKPLIAFLFIMIALLAARLSLPYFYLLDTYVFREDVFKLPRSVDPVYLMSPNSYLVPLVNTWLQPFWPVPEGSIEDSLFLGIAEVGLFLGWVFGVRKKMASFLMMGIGILFVIVSLGIPIGPGDRSLYSALQALFPFSIIWESERFFVIYYLLFTYFIVQLLDRFKARRVVAVLVLFVLVVERFTGSYYLTPVARLTGHPYKDAVAKMKTGAVMDVPFLYRQDDVASPTTYNLLPIYYKKPIVGGYFHWLAENESGLDRLSGAAKAVSCTNASPLQRRQAEAIHKALLAHEVRVVVVHKPILDDERCRLGRSRWDELLAYMGSIHAATRVFTSAAADVFYIDQAKSE